MARTSTTARKAEAMSPVRKQRVTEEAATESEQEQENQVDTKNSAEEDNDGEDSGDDEDDEDDSSEPEFDVEAHLLSAQVTLKEARARFFKYSREFLYNGKLGDYIIRGDCNEKTNLDAMGYGWPCAFVGEEPQPVSAAMWVKKPENELYLLVSVWTFSPTGDETNVYHLEEYGEDIFAGCGYGWNDINKEVITSEDCRHAFSISSGDQAEDNLYCPALENISIAEMAGFSLLVPNNTRTRDDVCEAHGEENICEYCRFHKKPRRN